MWMLRHPRESEVIEFLMKSAQKPLNYASQAALLGGRQTTQISTQIHLGTGLRTFRSAVEAMHAWQMIRLAGADLFWPDRGLQLGTTLAIGIRAYGAYWLNPCRITNIREDQEEDRSASDLRSTVGWQTVEGHSLRGSEFFSVRYDVESGDVWYEVSSVATPVGCLRACRSLIDGLRREFQSETCRQMAIVLGCHNPHKRTFTATEGNTYKHRV